MSKGYSERAIEELDDFPSGELIQLIYGIVTRASSWEGDLMIGDQRVKEGNLISRLKSLRKKTNKVYGNGIVGTEYMDLGIGSYEQKEGESKMNTVMVVGRELPIRIDASGVQSADSIVANKDLVAVINDSENILNDLRSIGFPDNIEQSDLYLHASFYRD